MTIKNFFFKLNRYVPITILNLFIILIFCSRVFANEQPAFLKVEKGDPLVSVFTQPGLNWKNCKKDANGDCIDGIGWLDKDAKVWIVGDPVKRIVTDPFTGKDVEEEYYPVKFEYSRKVGDTIYSKEKGPIGYVDAAYLGFEKQTPILAAEEIVNPFCGLKSADHGLENAKNAIEEKCKEETSDIIKSKIGQCISTSGDSKKSNLYDDVILKELVKVKPAGLSAEGGRPVTNSDLVAIDSLARTMYGEMASCYKHGLEYPMAVARIALNRAENKKLSKLFIRGKHHPSKLPMAKVVTSPTQFNVWLRKLNSDANPSKEMALCPPRNPAQKMKDGRKPSPQELSIWNHTVRIATEAVLFPEDFKKKTEGLADIYYYTSGMGKFYDMELQNRSIAGRKISRTGCVELWKE